MPISRGARGGPDNSPITERGIRGLFYDALESTFQMTWASRVAMAFMDSDQEIETHRWLGQLAGFRKWIGGLQANGMGNFEIIVRNEDYEDTLAVSLHDLRRDKIGHMRRRMGELGLHANVHWDELLVALIELNPLAYDNVAFFSDAHVVGDSGTMKNLLTPNEIPALNVVVPQRPTKTEAIDILSQASSWFYKFKTDKGKKANQGAKKFLVLCPPDMEPGFQAAVAGMMNVQGGDNEQKALGRSYEIVPEPDLSDDTAAYMFRTDAPSSKPLIIQEEVAPHVDLIGEDSEHAKKNNEILVIGKTTRGVGPGEFRQALKLQLG